MAWGPTQLIIVALLIIFLFGSKKLPELAHSLGKSLGEFKKGKEEGDKETAKAAPKVERKDGAPEVVTPEIVG